MILSINKEDCVISFTRYATGNRTAIRATDMDGVPYATLTVNLPETDVAEDELILDTNNLPTVMKDLKAAGVVSDPVRFAYSGYCEYPIVKLLKEI